jgi:predicted NBD/HSP70 family sugar kinase
MAQLLFDIGGTKMRLGVSVDGVTLSEPAVIPTPTSFAEAIEQIKKAASGLAQGKKIEVVCGGVAGTLNQEQTVLLSAPHLLEWVNQPLVEILGREFNCPIYLENDTAVVGLGEAIAACSESVERDKGKIIAYLTISTGVGGVRIVDGRIDRHLTSFEPGHQIIDLNQPEKHLEDYVSGWAVRQSREQEPKDIHDEVFWQGLAKILAIGLHNTILHWTPELVILGGSMMKEPGIKLAEVEKRLRQSLAFLPVQPKLKLAQLGDLGGLHGALAFLKQKLSTL